MFQQNRHFALGPVVGVSEVYEVFFIVEDDLHNLLKLNQNR
jgi:hypothetical protein